MIRCTACGAENPGEGERCSVCGAALEKKEKTNAVLLGRMGEKRYSDGETASEPTEEKPNPEADPEKTERALPKKKVGTGLAGSMGGVRYSAAPAGEKPKAVGAEPTRPEPETPTRKEGTGLAGSMGGVRYSAAPATEKPEAAAAEPTRPEPETPARKEGTGLAGSMGGVRYSAVPKETAATLAPLSAAPGSIPPVPPTPSPEPERHRTDRGTLIALIAAALAVAAAVLVIFQGAIQSSSKMYGMGLGGFINYYTPVEEEQIREEEGIRYAGNQLVIVSGMNLTYEEMERYFQEKNMTILGYIELIDTYQVELSQEYNLQELHRLAKELERDTRVDSATVNAVRELEGFARPADPWGNQADWNRASSGSTNWGVMAIHAPESWERFEPELVRVGVIDSMFDVDQGDINFAMTKDNDIIQYFPNTRSSAYGHGTHVSGTIGAIHDNNRGVSGVAENCEIYGYCAFDYETTIDTVSAIAELAAQDVRVINYSMGYMEELSELAMSDHNMEWDIYYNSASKFCESALVHLLKKDYDFLLVCAAGNEPVDATWTSVFTYITNPAVKSRILVVGAAGVNSQGEFYQASWSALGPRVDVVAPGVAVYSTLPGGQYDCWDGTSMAAPHVTGICASVWAIAPKLTGAEVKQIVVETATTPVLAGDANMVNMEAAMEAALRR